MQPQTHTYLCPEVNDVLRNSSLDLSFEENCSCLIKVRHEESASSWMIAYRFGKGPVFATFDIDQIYVPFSTALGSIGLAEI